MFYYILLSMQNVLEQGPDFWCWFDKLSFHAIVFTQFMHAKMFSIQMLLYTFQSNCGEGLHFSAFHFYCSNYYYYYYYYDYYCCCCFKLLVYYLQFPVGPQWCYLHTDGVGETLRDTSLQFREYKGRLPVRQSGQKWLHYELCSFEVNLTTI